MELLVYSIKLQSGHIVLGWIIHFPNDKNGGCSVMNTEDYISACETMLYAKYKDENSVEQS